MPTEVAQIGRERRGTVEHGHGWRVVDHLCRLDQNGRVPGAHNHSPLSEDEWHVVEALLSEARGDRVGLASVEKIWGRDNVLRVQLDRGGSAVVKLARTTEPERREHGFGVELAALQYLSSMSAAIAPRLLGSDFESGVLVMEELPPGGSLADSLLAGAGADYLRLWGGTSRSTRNRHATFRRVLEFWDEGVVLVGLSKAWFSPVMTIRLIGRHEVPIRGRGVNC
jgi:hypothetical protein